MVVSLAILVWSRLGHTSCRLLDLIVDLECIIKPRPRALQVLFFVLWQNGFVSALSQFTIAHATAEWYFAPFDTNGKKARTGAGAE